jgi:hypothetical protein
VTQLIPLAGFLRLYRSYSYTDPTRSGGRTASYERTTIVAVDFANVFDSDRCNPTIERFEGVPQHLKKLALY